VQPRNYVYLSKRKVDLYFPQVPAALLDDSTVKVGFNLHVVKGEISKAGTPLTENQKLERIIAYLEKEGLVGTIERPKKFFEGTFSAKSITDGSIVFFGGTLDLPDRKQFVGLVCSIDNMIGLKRSDLPNYSQRSVGWTQTEYFVQNSNSLGFASLLNNLSAIHGTAIKNDFDLDSINRARREKYELTEDERNVLSKRSWANGILKWADPPGLRHIFRGMIFGALAKKLLSVFVGRKLLDEKSSVLNKIDYYQGIDIKIRLEKGDIETLESAFSVYRSTDSPFQNYHFHAVFLNEGLVNGNHILLGSPLYLA
jgi:hypothetical protein